MARMSSLQFRQVVQLQSDIDLRLAKRIANTVKEDGEGKLLEATVFAKKLQELAETSELTDPLKEKLHLVATW
jgi:hypothetical protein